MSLTIFYQVLNLVYELPEAGTHMPKHVGEVKGCTFMYVCILCAVTWFYKWMLSKMHGITSK